MRRTILIPLVVVAALSAFLVDRLRRRRGQGSDVGERDPLEGVRHAHPLDELTRDELYARARARDIPGRSKMNKAELRRALATS